jgi:hypothetical protein
MQMGFIDPEFLPSVVLGAFSVALYVTTGSDYQLITDFPSPLRLVHVDLQGTADLD